MKVLGWMGRTERGRPGSVIIDVEIVTHPGLVFGQFVPVLDLELTRDYQAPGNQPVYAESPPVNSRSTYGVDTGIRSLWTELIDQSRDYEDRNRCM